MNKSVILLDFDGVINNQPYLMRVGRYDSFDPESIDQLNRVLTETGADIVVSSTWRKMYDLAGLEELLMLSGLVPGRVIGHTPITRSYISRGAEIRRWLNDHPEVTNWVVVDDDTDMHDLPLERVVFTLWEEGLQREHADRMIAILKGGST